MQTTPTSDEAATRDGKDGANAKPFSAFKTQNQSNSSTRVDTTDYIVPPEQSIRQIDPPDRKDEAGHVRRRGRKRACHVRKNHTKAARAKPPPTSQPQIPRGRGSKKRSRKKHSRKKPSRTGRGGYGINRGRREPGKGSLGRSLQRFISQIIRGRGRENQSRKKQSGIGRGGNGNSGSDIDLDNRGRRERGKGIFGLSLRRFIPQSLRGRGRGK
ncbi:hypothetical protein PG987_010300 [Apiospora arundinis]